ncbi:MAG TPA: chloride channel protein [Luteibaculaceae bacterium]|nr:chloride channel protein [Luteibaculaceae bacterium]
MIAAVFIGLTAGVAAIALKSAVHYLHYLLTTGLQLEIKYFILIISPLCGLVITTWIIHRFLKGVNGYGLAGVLREIAQKAGFVAKEKMYSQLITATTTVGFGGSTGLEAPIVVTGAAIGSNFAKSYHVNQKERYVLLAAGAAAGISAVFNAPITGFIFAIEVLLVDVSIAEFVPLIVASVTGALCSTIILNEDILFQFKGLQEFSFGNMPYYLLLGTFCGLASVYYARLRHVIESTFQLLGNKPYLRAVTGGLLLATLCVAFPQLFGEGYDSVLQLTYQKPAALLENTILQGFSDNVWFLLVFIGLVGAVKVIATSITIASGGNGGNFAPSMFVGAYTGFFFSSVINQLKIASLPVSNFALVGMAGLVSGIMYAPLTAIFLIAELTGGYELIIPLMTVSAISFFITQHFEPHSLEVKNLVEQGQILTADKDRNILTLIKTSQVVDRNAHSINVDQTLSDLVALIQQGNQYVFAVVDKQGALVGVVLFESFKDLLTETHLHHQIKVGQLMKQWEAVVNIKEDMQRVMQKFEKTNADQLPVTENGIFIGFISKTTVFNHYREQLITQSGLN